MEPLPLTVQSTSLNLSEGNPSSKNANLGENMATIYHRL